MVNRQPEKPWTNKTPAPDPDRLLTLDPGNVGSVEKTGPGAEYAFDADRGMINQVAVKNDFDGLIEKLKGKEKQDAEALFSAFGSDVMKTVIHVGEQNKDRAWEMVEMCARQTGVSFPHILQVCAELFILCSRPIDKWSIAESHTGKMRIHQYSCSYLKAQEEAGLSTAGLPCRMLCLSAFEFAAGHRNVSVAAELTRQLPVDKVCEFTFIPK